MQRECFGDLAWSIPALLERTTRVACVDEKVVGFVVLQDVFTGGEEPVYITAAQAGEVREREILDLAVLPAYRRLGVARALLASEMQRPGIYYLQVRQSNAGAMRLYESLGFVEIARCEHFYNSPDETAVVMKAGIRPEAAAIRPLRQQASAKRSEASELRG